MLVQVVERGPAKLAKLAIDASGCSFQLVTNILIGLYIATGSGRDLGITDLAMMLRVLLKQRLIGEESLRQPFRVVKPLHGENILHIFQLILQLSQLRRQRAFGVARNFVRIDPNRINLGTERLTPCLIAFVPEIGESGLHGNAVKKGGSVAFGLEAQQIVIAQLLQQLGMRR